MLTGRAVLTIGLSTGLLSLAPIASAAPADDEAGPAPEIAAAAEPVPDADAEPPAATRTKKKKRRKRAGWRVGGFRVKVGDTEASSSAGYLHGHRTLPLDAAVIEVGAGTRAEATRGRWRVRLPLEASHRDTAGASLTETRGEVALEVRYRHSRALRLTAEAGITGVWRPDWADQYQPLAGGGYASTDRYSHWDRKVELDLASTRGKHDHSHLRYDYRVVDYRSDAAFDPVDEPTHLVPSDHDRHRLRASWRRNGRRTELGASAEIWLKDYFYAFARDAGTGATHAAPGGAAPNPLQRLVGGEPEIGLEHSLRPWTVEVDYGFEVVSDTFEGYYSYTGHHPQVTLSRRFGKHRVALGAELWWRRYGDGSYAASATHPPLTYGDRRVDRKGEVELEATYRLARGWSATAGASLVRRRTNFPSYEPGVFPASRMYDIDWNYDNWAVMIGVTHRP